MRYFWQIMRYRIRPKRHIMRPGAVNFCKMCGQVRQIFAKCAAIMRRFYANCAADVSEIEKQYLKIVIFERDELSNLVS